MLESENWHRFIRQPKLPAEEAVGVPIYIATRTGHLGRLSYITKDRGGYVSRPSTVTTAIT